MLQSLSQAKLLAMHRVEVFYEVVQDPLDKLFNAILESKDVRAIELRDGNKVNDSGLSELVREAVLLYKK